MSAATLLNGPCIHYSIITESGLLQAVVTGATHLSNDQLVEPAMRQERAEVLCSIACPAGTTAYQDSDFRAPALGPCIATQ